LKQAKEAAMEFTTEELLRFLEVTESKFRKLCKQQPLTQIKPGLYLLDDVLTWLENFRKN
jgi:hypothetical protein